MTIRSRLDRWVRRACAVVAPLLMVPSTVLAALSVPDETVVVRIGSREIDAGEFEAGLARFEPDTTLSVPEQRRQYLESLIDRHLMVLEIEERGLVEANPSIAADARLYGQYLVIQRIRREEILSAGEVTEAALRDFYARQGSVYDVSQIQVATEEEAREALRRLEAGESFEALAEELSLDAKSRRKGGKLSSLVWGVTNAYFMEPLVALEPGGVTDVIPSDYGYHILRLDGVTRREQEPFEGRREFLAQRLSMRQQSDRQAEFFHELRQRYGFEADFEVAARLAAIYAGALDSAEETESNTHPDNIAAVAMGRIQIPPEMLEEKIATWDNWRYTVGDHWLYTSSFPAAILLDRRNPHQIINDAASEFHRAAMARLGEERGYAEAPEVLEGMALKREEIALNHLYHQEILAAATFTEEEERAYYAENPTRFDRAAGVKVARIRYRERAPAIEMEEALAGVGDDPDSVAARHERAGWIESQETDSGWITYNHDAALFERAFTMKPGDVGRYIEPEGLWSVFVLIERDEGGRYTFEEAREQIRKDLQTLRSEEVLKTFLAGLRDKYEVWIHPELAVPAP